MNFVEPFTVACETMLNHQLMFAFCAVLLPQQLLLKSRDKKISGSLLKMRPLYKNHAVMIQSKHQLASECVASKIHNALSVEFLTVA
jgi:hypothetical protein